MNQHSYITSHTQDQGQTYITISQTTDSDVAIAVVGFLFKFVMFLVTSPVMVPLMVQAWRKGELIDG